jgi:deoxycytidylate deaminase
MDLSPIAPIDPAEVCAYFEIKLIPLSDINPQSTFLGKDNSSFSAVTVPCGCQRAIVHNDSHHPYRQRSNVCHELAHCFLGHKCTPPLTEKGERARDGGVEAEANFLAGTLLMPNEAALYVVRKGLVMQAQGIYGVSSAKLIGRDDSEEDETTGQRVRDVFPMADVIVNASHESEMGDDLGRFFEVFFGCPTRSPNLDEYGMSLAFNAALRSIDMSRQIGAAIMSSTGEILALGCNEVPKAGGGTYREGDTGDARDAVLGEDQNVRRKRLMIADAVYRLAKFNLLPERFMKTSLEDVAKELIDEEGAPLKESLIMDGLEFGRMLHAEMCAISEAARIGIPLKGQSLYVTAFPCHNCAKHIVGVGILDVVYLQPYPKSHVPELYPDSIDVDPIERHDSRIRFRQYVGIMPARFYLFEKERLKDESGKIKKWEKATSNPISRQVVQQQFDIEKFAISSFQASLGRITPSQASQKPPTVDATKSGCAT